MFRFGCCPIVSALLSTELMTKRVGSEPWTFWPKPWAKRERSRFLRAIRAHPIFRTVWRAQRRRSRKYPNMKLNTRGIFYHVEIPEKAAEFLQNAQGANPEIQGWAMLGGWPLFTADALKWPAGSIKVVAVDALPAELVYVKNGYVDALLAQDCYGWGTKSVDILLNKIINNQAPPEVKLIDPLTLVTKENVDSYGENWKKLLQK